MHKNLCLLTFVLKRILNVHVFIISNNHNCLRTQSLYGTVHLVYDGGVVCLDHQFHQPEVFPPVRHVLQSTEGQEN